MTAFGCIPEITVQLTKFATKDKLTKIQRVNQTACEIIDNIVESVFKIKMQQSYENYREILHREKISKKII